MKIIDIIAYEGDNSTFIWKHPSEDFNTLSQLIVHESQEALLFLNGQALDLFGPGRHTLHTQNIPLLSKIINIPTNGETPFHCEVYFINKTEQMAINWGMGGVIFRDPQHNDYPFKIGASGEMSLAVSDSRKIITKLVGTEAILDQEMIKKYFRTPIITHIKTILPNILHEKGYSIFDVESDLSGLSEILKNRISEEMDDYGITLEKFWINTIVQPEEDSFYKTIIRQRGDIFSSVTQGQIDMQLADNMRKVGLISHSGEDQKRRMDIDTKRYEQEQLGYSYQQERGFDVMEKIAQNEGSGSDLRNAAMGLGMGFRVGGVFGDELSNISRNTMMSNLTEPVAPASANNATMGNIPGMINLKNDESNTKKNAEQGIKNSFEEKVKMLVVLKENGILTDEEFLEKKKALLDEIMGG